MLLEWTQSREAKLDHPKKVVESLLRWFAEISATIFKPATYLLRPSHPASAEKPAESAAVTAGAVPASSLAAEVSVDPDARIDYRTQIELGTQEVECRRNLVRTLFNDFWAGAHDKPAAFVQRLDQAEDYINERLAANGEVWHLDAKTRVMLGLPPRSNS